jgi:hypothetical protein
MLSGTPEKWVTSPANPQVQKTFTVDYPSQQINQPVALIFKSLLAAMD